MFLVFVTFAHFSVRGQTLSSANETYKQTPKKRFTIYYHLGSVELPEGYKGYITTNWNDAWLGYIESPKSNFKIGWAGGLVESLFEKYKKNLVDSETETTLTYSIKFGLFRDKKEETLIASIGDIQFSAIVKDENDKTIFKEIIRSYQKERCETCRSFGYKTQEEKSEK